MRHSVRGVLPVAVSLSPLPLENGSRGAGLALAVVIPLWNHADSVHGRVILMRGQGPWYTVSVQKLRRLEAARGLEASLRPALPDHRLVGHGGLVLEHSLSKLRGAVVGHAGQPGDQGPRGEVGGEVLIGQPVHGLNGGDRAAAIRGHAGPGIAANVLEAGHGLAGGRGAGVHAGLPLG